MRDDLIARLAWQQNTGDVPRCRGCGSTQAEPWSAHASHCYVAAALASPATVVSRDLVVEKLAHKVVPPFHHLGCGCGCNGKPKAHPVTADEVRAIVAAALTAQGETDENFRCTRCGVLVVAHNSLNGALVCADGQGIALPPQAQGETAPAPIDAAPPDVPTNGSLHWAMYERANHEAAVSSLPAAEGLEQLAREIAATHIEHQFDDCYKFPTCECGRDSRRDGLASAILTALRAVAEGQK